MHSRMHHDFRMTSICGLFERHSQITAEEKGRQAEKQNWEKEMRFYFKRMSVTRSFSSFPSPSIALTKGSSLTNYLFTSVYIAPTSTVSLNSPEVGFRRASILHNPLVPLAGPVFWNWHCRTDFAVTFVHILMALHHGVR